jgi:hypothetical protein
VAKWLTVAISGALLGNAQATPIGMIGSMNGWRVENYANDQVVIWFASTPCTNGQLTFPSTFTKSDLNRFWATVTAAKVSGAKMFLYYDNANAPVSCPVISFGLESS